MRENNGFKRQIREKMSGEFGRVRTAQQNQIVEAPLQGGKSWGGQDKVAKVIGLENAYSHRLFPIGNSGSDSSSATTRSS